MLKFENNMRVVILRSTVKGMFSAGMLCVRSVNKKVNYQFYSTYAFSLNSQNVIKQIQIKFRRCRFERTIDNGRIGGWPLCGILEKNIVRSGRASHANYSCFRWLCFGRWIRVCIVLRYACGRFVIHLPKSVYFDQKNNNFEKN